MMALVYDDNIPGAALHNAFAILAKRSLMDTRPDESITIQSCIGIRASNPLPCIQAKLVSKFCDNVSHESRWRQVEHANGWRLFQQALHNHPGLNCLPEADFISDQNTSQL